MEQVNFAAGMFAQESSRLLERQMRRQNAVTLEFVYIRRQQPIDGVIRLDENFRESARDIGRLIGVGDVKHAVSHVAQNEIDGLGGVVYGREHFDVDAADIERVAGFDDVQIVAVQVQRVGSALSREDIDAALKEVGNGARVVGMFVSEQDRVGQFVFELLANPSRLFAAINEKQPVGSNGGTVARRARRQNIKPHVKSLLECESAQVSRSKSRFPFAIEFVNQDVAFVDFVAV